MQHRTQHRTHTVQPSTSEHHRPLAADWRNYQRFCVRPWDNDEPPRQVAQRRARAHTHSHARTCRRPSVSCVVNYVHKFHVKFRPHVNGCSRISEPPKRADSGRTGRKATANIVWNRTRTASARRLCLARTDGLDDSGVDIQQHRKRRTKKIYRKGGNLNGILVCFFFF